MREQKKRLEAGMRLKFIQMTLKDIGYICKSHEWLSNNNIVLYIRLLYEKMDGDARKNKFGFINPAAIHYKVNKEVFVRNVLNGLQDSVHSRKYIFIPCNTGVSQSLGRELGFKTSEKKVFWVDVKVRRQHTPKQKGSWECGFYIMLYMKHIIESYDTVMQNPHEMFKLGMKYGTSEIDEVRKEWIDYVAPFLRK
ncbi:uncharacterized protein LOC113355566 isoform X2 [Papaver somniferum]|uniref:uncharacterized protein LOC113355566 isoform X2 n=1 Tax=Papaver somniferum TaxID=3469 RepID=UPI000E6F91FC|nr:uncharacterized protein LOC113355566 isoform X2 [Papaver somniferum]